jgi:hypothetical protein
MPTLKELFKTKILSSGKTAEEQYAVRNSKDIQITTSNPILNSTAFPLVQKNLRSNPNITNKNEETLVESELVGLRAIRLASAPIIYGTDIVRISTQRTNVVGVMKSSINGNDNGSVGVLGAVINKVTSTALGLTTKLGIQFPENLIPTKVSLNDKFRKGLEPDTMKTLSEIKGDGAGNIVGKFLAQNAKGTPNQIGRQVIGSGIDAIKTFIRKKLIGSPLVGAQNLATKTLEEIQYDRISYYSNTIYPQTDDIVLRNDLSSIFDERQKRLSVIKAGTDGSEKLLSGVSNLTDTMSVKFPTLTNSRFGKISDKLKSVTAENQSKLSAGRKKGQRDIAKTENINDNFQYESEIPYSNTVDESSDDIQLRNDLSTKLENINNAILALTVGGSSVDRNKKRYTESEFNEKTLVQRNWSSASDFINSKPAYNGSELILANGDSLDAYDFIPLKFTSVLGGKSINFPAVISGLSETLSPQWESSKFLGSPFNYYNYTAIDRTISFDMKLFSLNPKEHILMWQKIDFLTSLVYPVGYVSDTYVTPPFLKFTMGDLYKNKECFISSLSYTFDDNGGWELGNPINGDNRFDINGELFDMKRYKLPRHVSVSIGITFIESRGNTENRKYGFSPVKFNNSKINGIT